MLGRDRGAICNVDGTGPLPEALQDTLLAGPLLVGASHNGGPDPGTLHEGGGIGKRAMAWAAGNDGTVQPECV